MDAFYEEPGAVAEYLHFHYGSPEEILPYRDGPRDALGFAQRAVDELLPAQTDPLGAALDVGCAVGRSTFELSRHIPHVIGVDYSRAFIEAANALRTNGSLTYEYVVEGIQTRKATASVPPGVDVSRVHFETGDAMQLRPELGPFSLVFAANLICRLSEPLRFLERLPALVQPGGYLLLCTPWTWMEQFTPRENWLGGTDNGPRSSDALQEILSPDFECEISKDLPFLIREHERKFQWGVSQGTRWRRRQ